jgi:hypothetical protein
MSRLVTRRVCTRNRSSARPSTISVTYDAMMTRSSNAIDDAVQIQPRCRPSAPQLFRNNNTLDAVPAARWVRLGGRAQAYSVSYAGPNKDTRPVLTLDR